jgi:hypothetical protein
MDLRYSLATAVNTTPIFNHKHRIGHQLPLLQKLLGLGVGQPCD